MKKTLLIGASVNPDRYANKAAKKLLAHQHELVQLGIRDGEVEGNKFLIGKPPLSGVDTITLYINPSIQKEYYNYILEVKPQRVIFNPGTENPELEALLVKNKIEVIEACTLVMLTIGNY
jgi:uncharacterized protein